MERRQLLKSLGLGTGMIIGGAVIGQAADLCGRTPQQTEGPFYPIKDQDDKDWDLTQLTGNNRKAEGEEVIIVGKVLDQNCKPIPGTLVEIWQACTTGKYNHPNDPNTATLDPNFQYWGKATTDSNGAYLFKTIIPGAYPADTGWIRPPHIHYKVHQWGYKELTTQLYFDGNQYNKTDRILNGVPKSERSKVVRPIETKIIDIPGEAPATHRVVQFDITLEKA